MTQELDDDDDDMIFMQIKRQIEWWAACLRGGGMEDGNQERSFGVHLDSIVLLLVPLAPVSLALNHLNEIYGLVQTFPR